MAAAAQGEAYRVLRSNVEVSLADLERPTVLVTSANAGEGKTATSVNLARSLAQGGKRVVLVDLDLRHPDAHNWLGGHNEFGVADVLLGRRPLEECVQLVPVGLGATEAQLSLYLLAPGTGVRNPTELLGTRRVSLVLEALCGQADIVVIDSPPVLPVADSLVIGRIVAGALLVVESRRTPIGAIHQAKDALTRNQTRLLGLVINKLQPKDADFGYGYQYGYGYGDRPEQADDS